MKAELLAPAGDLVKLKVALHFGADAVYFGGTAFSLRAFAGNFGDDEIREAFRLLHAAGKKGYVTVNIFPRNADFGALEEALKRLEGLADGVIVSDPGVIALAKKAAPKLPLHLSTQANTLNKYAAKFWHEEGVSRIVLARELPLADIREIRDALPDACELEAFVHGAMCISYSGRCLLSNYLNGRDANRGECVQACRWQYALSPGADNAPQGREVPYPAAELTEAGRRGMPLTLEEDGRGSYLLNSRDLKLVHHLAALEEAGVGSFKIEGRMKSEYYVGTVVNAYRRVMDGGMTAEEADEELEKTGHRAFTTAYLLGENDLTQCAETSKPDQTCDFAALVLERRPEGIVVEQRNRFLAGDQLEVLSAGPCHGQTLRAAPYTLEGEPVADAKLVQQRLLLRTDLSLAPWDMLRKAR